MRDRRASLLGLAMTGVFWQLPLNSLANWTVIDLSPQINSDVLAFGSEALLGGKTFESHGTGGAAIWHVDGSFLAPRFVNLEPNLSGEDWSIATGSTEDFQIGTVFRYGGAGSSYGAIWRGAPGTMQLVVGGEDYGRLFAAFGDQAVGGSHFYHGKLGTQLHRAVLFEDGQPLIQLHPDGLLSASESIAFGVHGGQQVGVYRSGSPWNAVLWGGTPGSVLNLHPPGTQESAALSVYEGVQGGYVRIGGVRQAGVWHGSPQSFESLSPAGVPESWITSMCSAGQAGVAKFGSELRAAFWQGTPESYEEMGFAPVGGPGFLFLGVDGAPQIWSDGPYTFALAGLREVAVRGTVTAPGSWTIVRGALVAGGLASLLSGDENKAVFRPGPTLSSSQRPIEIRLSFLAPQLNSSAVSLAVEASASSASIEQSIALYNYRLAKFDEVDSNLMSTGDRGRRPDVTVSPEDYVDAKTGLSRARLTYRATAPVLSFPWQVRIDYVAWMASKAD